MIGDRYEFDDAVTIHWTDFVERLTTTVHESDLGEALGHRGGFCIACAELYGAFMKTMGEVQ